MANIKISELAAGGATASHVVAADNAAGTVTNKIALGAIPGLAAPQAHGASHGLAGSDAIVIAAQQVVSNATSPNATLDADLGTIINSIAGVQSSVSALPGSFPTASINYTKVSATNAVWPNIGAELNGQVAYLDGQYAALDAALGANITSIQSTLQDYYPYTVGLSWVPEIRQANNAASGLSYTSTGYAIRMGEIVIATGYVAMSAVPGLTPAGAPWITGFPYAVSDAGMGTIYNPAAFITSQHLAFLFGEGGLTRMRIRLRSPSGTTPGGGSADATFGLFTASSSFRFQCIYRTTDPF